MVVKMMMYMYVLMKIMATFYFNKHDNKYVLNV